MASPGFSQNLQAIQRQEQTLLPRLLQSVEVLQLPALELDAYLWEAAQANEALALEPRRGEEPAAGPRGGRAATERHAAWLESLPARGEGLVEHLERELALVDVPAALAPWVRFVVEALDERGLLAVPDERLLELAREQGLEGGATELGRAIGIVQGLEPRGVGARDEREALLLQLAPREPDYPLLCRLIEEFLDELSRNRLPAVARGLGVELEELEHLLQRLRELDLEPGLSLGGSASPPVQPDVSVRRGEHGLEVEVLDAAFPAVRLDEDVARLARDRGQEAPVRRYLRGRVERARWLIEALGERRATLARVATHVFSEQRGFLDRGPGHLRPLSMTDTAEALGLHVSTVSRAAAGKHVDTPWGIFPLRSFFQGAAGSNPEVSRDRALDRIRELVAREDPARPLSDGELVERLAGEGLELARRTVAKYRQELGIASSYLRRRHA